ncbi:unnamed protein product [Adineta steineri]|uniref:Potassium channel domain-containing protein n=1 Tax=Adineta steineri TaxID=433720 RepID=A0A815GY99_9BILA|nr:unnamed protein product [Adineta steineri]CAF3581800.1 unnamed protein product [Adineta steineri]
MNPSLKLRSSISNNESYMNKVTRLTVDLSTLITENNLSLSSVHFFANISTLTLANNECDLSVEFALNFFETSIDLTPMASEQDPKQPLINPFVHKESLYTEPIPPTTVLDMIPHPLSNKRKLRRTVSIKPSERHAYMANLSERLSTRKYLHRRLAFVSDLTCGISMLGIILMIIGNEITFDQMNDRDTPTSWFIKLILTFSTVILVVLILVYHRLELALYSVNNCIEDWRVGITFKKIMVIIFEVIICFIHPIPMAYPTESRIQEEDAKNNVTSTPGHPLTYIPLDVALGLPMFLRLYLLCRCIVYHSQLVRNAASRSFGYLNQVKINFSFLIRIYLQRWPTRCLLVICIMSFLIGSWALRACNYKPSSDDHFPMSDAMWLFVVTFTSLGYGDLIASTHCGRIVAGMVSVYGLFASALLIAVLAQKLMLDRSEKYVHSFVLNTQLTKERQEQSANIIKFALKLWVWKAHTKSFSFAHYLRIQRKLFRSIKAVHEIRRQEQVLIDNSIDQVELATMQHKTITRTELTNIKIRKMEVKVDTIEEQLINVNNTINNIQNTLNILVNKISGGNNI